MRAEKEIIIGGGRLILLPLFLEIIKRKIEKAVKILDLLS